MIFINKITNPKILRYIVPLAGLAIISRTFRYFDVLYYILPLVLIYLAIVAINEIRKEPELKFLLSLNFIFFLWILATCLWSIYPEISLKRSIYYFLLSTGTITAGFVWCKYFKRTILSFLIPANMFIIILSLFSIITIVPADSWTGGHGKGFMGFAVHQNTLAASILFTIPAILVPLLKGRRITQLSMNETNEKKSKRVKVFYFFLLVLNVFFLILTYSRTSILALIAAYFIYIFITLNKKLLLISLILIISFFLTMAVSNSSREWSKKLLLKDFSTLFESRKLLWIPSYQAALDGGIIGLGYGVSTPNIFLNGTASRFKNGVYVREKGNSILALIEEAGLLGIVLFLAPIIYIIYRLFITLYKLKYPENGQNSNCEPVLNKFKNSNSLSSDSILQWQISKIEFSLMVLMLSFMAAFLLHSMFEAWFVGIGSTQLPLFFVFIGVALALIRVEK